LFGVMLKGFYFGCCFIGYWLKPGFYIYALIVVFGCYIGDIIIVVVWVLCWLFGVIL